MNILATLLLLGATGSATRSLETDQEIAGIVLRVAWGAMSDVGLRGLLQRPGKQAELSEVRLTIDGQRRTGFRAWGEAVIRVAAYASDWRADGSVDYTYRLQVRDYRIARHTEIRDGRIVLTTDVWWTEAVPVIGKITRKVPIHVRLVIEATEHGGRAGTSLSAVATGTADTADFRCPLVRRRRAEPEAAATLDRELAAVLWTIQRQGIEWYHGAAEVTDVLDKIGDGIRTIGRLRRR